MSSIETTSNQPPTASWSRQLAVRLWPVSVATSDLAALDGLRGLAVLLTMGFHLCWHLLLSGAGEPSFDRQLSSSQVFWNFGQSGVHLFFVLSGFLLFLPYAKAMLGVANYPDWRNFYLRRARRILPGYWVALALIVLVISPQYLAPEHWSDIALHFFLIHDVSEQTRNSINSPFWTMAVEAHYYLLLPLCSAIIWYLAVHKHRRAVGGFFAIMLFSYLGYGLLVPFALHYAPFLQPLVGLLFVIKFLVVFTLGMLAALLYVAATNSRLTDLPQARLCALGKPFGVGGLFLLLLYIVLNIYFGAGLETFYWLFREPLLGLGFTGVLLGVLLGWSTWQRVLASPGLRFIGVISYSLYIWNELIYQNLVIPLTLHFAVGWAALLLAIGLTFFTLIPIAFVFYQLVERPFMKASLRQR